MDKPPRRNIFSRISGNFFRRQLYFIIRPFRRVGNSIRYGLYRVLPYPVRRFFPYLERESYRAIREKVKEKLRQKQQEEDSKLVEYYVEDEVTEKVRLARLAKIPQIASGYINYDCINQEPLTCNIPLETSLVNPSAKNCHKCRFLAVLPLNSEIIGRKSRYQVISYLGCRGRGRLYRGIDINTEETVAIKEYLLPKLHFNEQETRQIRKVFENQGNLSLSDGRKQDFRLPVNAEAIGDVHDSQRCYLITNGNADNLPTLRLYLARYGAMSADLVRDVLNQILQILESLHYQKYRLATGKVQENLAHGNLNLDSVLIYFDRRPFFVKMPMTIYLTDLELWEDLFIPPPKMPHVADLNNDLVSLGYIAFYLLTGATIDEQNKPLNPRRQGNWHTSDLALKNYIDRLLQFKQPFTDVFTARQALLNLPSQPTTPNLEIDSSIVAKTKRKTPWWVWVIIATLTILLLSELLGWLIARRQGTFSQITEPVVCCVSQVTAIPRGNFNYTSARNGSWNYALTQENLIVKNETLETQLETQLPRFFQVEYNPTNWENNILSQLINQEVNFAIASTETLEEIDDNQLEDNPNFESEKFAYDGIAVLVAFSYNTGDQRLLASLNGQITINQLRQLYTGKIDNWRELGGADLPVKMYIPDNEEIIKVFETKVLQNISDINLFRSLRLNEDEQIQQTTNDNSSDLTITVTPQDTQGRIISLPIYRMLRTILREFEDEQVASIGFAPMSKIFGQCAVYPLAIATEDENQVQPFIQQNNQPIDINLDLCKAKGNYHPDVEVFQNQKYPLAYPLKVVYPRDNSLPPAGKKFAEILQTEQIQKAIAKTGLIPIHTMRDRE